jgi:hypothetical protein
MQRRFPENRRHAEQARRLRRRVTHAHGGLTPAALFRRAFVHRKNRFSSADVRHATQERGALAPRGTYQRECNGDPHIHRRRSAEQARLRLRKRVSHAHGGLTPAALVSARDECPRTCAVSVLQARYPHHGGLTPAALERRAFVHRKNRFFADKRSRSNTRAGGVSPPWELLTPIQRRFPHTPSAVPRTSTLASAQRLCERVCPGAPTAGSRPPLFFGVRSCIAKIVFSPASVRTPTQERGA